MTIIVHTYISRIWRYCKTPHMTIIVQTFFPHIWRYCKIPYMTLIVHTFNSRIWRYCKIPYMTMIIHTFISRIWRYCKIPYMTMIIQTFNSRIWRNCKIPYIIKQTFNYTDIPVYGGYIICANAFLPNNSNIDQYRKNSFFYRKVFLHSLWHSIICKRLSFIAMYSLPVKTEMGFRDRREKNNVPEITDFLRYCPMYEFFGGKVVELNYLKGFTGRCTLNCLHEKTQ